MAWVLRLRADFAEPPAESPSTRNNSVPSEEPLAQSASLPGSLSRLVADLRAVSLACRRLSRSSARSMTRSRRMLAAAGSPERK